MTKAQKRKPELWVRRHKFNKAQRSGVFSSRPADTMSYEAVRLYDSEDVQVLIEALKFYADEDNWEVTYRESNDGRTDGDCGCQMGWEDIEIKEDEGGPYYSCAGERARIALKILGVTNDPKTEA